MAVVVAADAAVAPLPSPLLPSSPLPPLPSSSSAGCAAAGPRLAKAVAAPVASTDTGTGWPGSKAMVRPTTGSPD